ncbi:MAG TPA: hypothetical protein PLO69_11210 [Gammaproteobacteria bacterium]|nr:hypothetical protein [Gammaproteobacteria bacterium]
MSWEEIERATNSKNSKLTEVTVSAPPPPKTGRQRLVIILRTALIEDCPSYLAVGAKVKALIGRNEHAGMVRIVPNGRCTLTTLGRAGATGSLALTLPMPDGQVVGQQPQTDVAFDYGTDWIEVTLPAWARSAVVDAPIAAPAGPPIAVVGPAPAPFSKTASVFRTAATNGAAPKPAAGGR